MLVFRNFDAYKALDSKLRKKVSPCKFVMYGTFMLDQCLLIFNLNNVSASMFISCNLQHYYQYSIIPKWYKLYHS